MGSELMVSTLNRNERYGYLFIAVSIAVMMGSTFHYFTDAHFPYLDAAATALSFVAQFLIAKKKIENWILWICVNVMYIGIYLYKDLYLYTALFTIYLALAVNGFMVWRKAMQNKITNEITG
jgi:nicotinamide mononucleotide transporter